MMAFIFDVIDRDIYACSSLDDLIDNPYVCYKMDFGDGQRDIYTDIWICYFPNVKGERILEPGDFYLIVGDQRVKFELVD